LPGVTGIDNNFPGPAGIRQGAPASGRRVLRWLLLCALAIALAGCAVRPPEGAPEALFDQRVARLQSVTDWQAIGRVAINTPEDSVTVAMEWRQAADAWRLDLRGPMGSGSVRLQGNADGVTLREADGTTAVADDPRDLLLRHTGYDLPVDVLRDWLRGMPAEGVPVELELDDHGRPTEILQMGWKIRYTNWSRVNGVELPARFSLDAPGINVRGSLRSWELDGD